MRSNWWLILLRSVTGHATFMLREGAFPSPRSFNSPPPLPLFAQELCNMAFNLGSCNVGGISFDGLSWNVDAPREAISSQAGLKTFHWNIQVVERGKILVFGS